ncbi:MAG: T9SS type A sorting domain-containing protein, partial [Flavobacteriales bacterium]
EANPYGHGNVFIAYNGGSSIYAIEAAFGANTTAGTSIIAEVHELGSSIQDIVDTYQSVYDVLPSDVNGGSNFSFTTIVLDEEVPLNAGTNYTISLQSEGFTDELWILSNSGDEDLSTTLYGPYGTGGSVNWYNGWEHTPGIRMNINPNISSVEEMLNETGFAVYPNPAVNELTLSFEEGSEVEMISIVDVEGKTVLEHLPNQVNGTKLTLDVSSIASGVYFVNVLSQKDSRTQKIIIK